MALKFNRLINIIVLIAILLASTIPFSPVLANIPVTADPFPTTPFVVNNNTKSSFISLSDFTTTLKDGTAVLRGVYVSDVLAFKVVQQPENQNGYVSTVQSVVTQFGMASDYGTIGLLAHNYLAGTEFSKVGVGNTINAIYGDGSIKVFKVTKIAQYQALQPNSASSNFLDLATNEKLSSGSLFKLMYGGKAHLTLQTCIAKDKEGSWGRLFVIAEPVQ